ncbi:response regulator transcription factor [Paenibacillus endoradicis]|uniref:response regulator transcription factor n=1 Tax=Paenibacillus endoradicis TaxID=2972487 RepID=UPI002158FC0F|nr:response regulator [Paenibacillus endoradicis]MCR8659587.1 response regulator [Paenibacillus endoradicis]
MNVIIVDDEPMIRAGFEKMISRLDMNIQVIGSYSNGFDALTHIDKIADHELDLLITDIKMPMMDGLKLIEAIQERSFAKMVFSGFSEFEYARKALRYGACDYLLKPIDKQQLVDVLARIKQQKQVQFNDNSAKSVEVLSCDQTDAGKVHHAIEKIKAILLKQYDRNFDLERIAETIGMSSHYVSRLFKQETGVTITDYLIDIRIDKAKQFLINYPHMKNYEISQSVGYSDPVYFQKLFKKVTGLTPREYKEINQ